MNKIKIILGEILISLTFQETLFWINDKKYSVLKTEKGVKDRTERRDNSQKLEILSIIVPYLGLTLLKY